MRVTLFRNPFVIITITARCARHSVHRARNGDGILVFVLFYGVFVSQSQLLICQMGMKCLEIVFFFVFGCYFCRFYRLNAHGMSSMRALWHKLWKKQ